VFWGGRKKEKGNREGEERGKQVTAWRFVRTSVKVRIFVGNGEKGEKAFERSGESLRFAPGSSVVLPSRPRKKKRLAKKLGREGRCRVASVTRVREEATSH